MMMQLSIFCEEGWRKSNHQSISKHAFGVSRATSYHASYIRDDRDATSGCEITVGILPTYIQFGLELKKFHACTRFVKPDGAMTHLFFFFSTHNIMIASAASEQSPSQHHPQKANCSHA